MKDESSTAIYAPTEYLSEISQLIKIGIIEAKFSREVKRNLTAWWDAESEFIDNKPS